MRTWLKGLGKDDRLRIGIDIKTVEYGWPIGMPVCRPLGHALFEVRTHLKDRISRVIFCITSDHMVLLHGFIKKTQKTHPSDIKLALERKRELEAKL